MIHRYALPLALGLLAAGDVARLPAQSGRLAAPLAVRIDSVFRRFTAPGSPGCALGVARDGALVYSKGYGLASVELGVPITPATVFEIGSVSKQFTAMSVVLLAQDGKLSLDDQIQRFIPEVPRYARPVTIRHLLHHTSGLRDYIEILGWSGIGEEAVTTDQDALDAIARQTGTNFEPGAEFLYSNSGFFLLSVIVKRAAGESLRAFAARRIFQPLGMTHTQYVDRHDMIVPGKAGSYADGAAGGFVLALANWEQTGDGAVNTTVEDLAKWDGNFVTGTVGGPAAIHELETPGVLNSGSAIEYALGLNVDSYRGVRRVSHGGSWAGFRAQLTRFPGQQLSIFTLCNLASSAPGFLAGSVADLLLRDAASGGQVWTPRPAAAEPRAWSREALAALVGVYHSDELLADLVVTLRNDSLFVRPGLGAEIPLRPTAGEAFSAFGTRVTPVLAAGRVTGLTLNNRGLRDFRLSRAP
ncbi:MAG TPA: serine hydrolase domain-containing protein [Gemmatimonadales bacterium]|nr:serine hydrolase domain-containing protein [Gemmatimonadales bacterium]